MINSLIEVLDVNEAHGRISDLEAEAMVRNYDPSYHTAPGIIGHASSYAKDTKIPAGLWVKSLSKRGSKVFAEVDFPGKMVAVIPDQYKELVGMSEFLREAVNKGLYPKRSIGFKGSGENTRLDHIAFLGGSPPECKGMSDIELAEHPEFKNLVYEFSGTGDLRQIDFTDSTMKFKLTAEQKRDIATRLTELADGVNTPPEVDPQIELDQLLALLRTAYGLDAGADTGQILGALQSEIKEQEDAKNAAAEAAKNFGLANGTDFASLKNDIRSLATKVKELADATTTTPVATVSTTNTTPTTDTTKTASTDHGIATLGLSPEDAQKAADAAKQALETAKNYLPQFDENIYQDFTTMANLKSKVGDGSILDTFVVAMSALPGLTEMSEKVQAYEDAGIELADAQSRIRQIKTPTGVGQTVTPNAKHVENADRDKKVRELMAQDKTLNYITADAQLGRA